MNATFGGKLYKDLTLWVVNCESKQSLLGYHWMREFGNKFEVRVDTTQWINNIQG